MNAATRSRAQALSREISNKSEALRLAAATESFFSDQSKAPTESEPIHARQAIVTRYLPPTNTKPSRIKASCDRASITIPFPQGEGLADAHAVAVRALLDKFHKEDASDGDFRFRSWPAFDRWVCGGMPQASKDAYVWVQLPEGGAL